MSIKPFLPTYRCRDCQKEWRRGGAFRRCPSCGKLPGEGGHKCVGMGFAGAGELKKKPAKLAAAKDGLREHKEG